MITRRHVLLGSLAAGALFAGKLQARAESWAAIEAAAKGQDGILQCLGGIGDDQCLHRLGSGGDLQPLWHQLKHVKITDAAEVVRRVRDEVKAGQDKGSVDLVWINGENFRAMKADKMLFGPFASSLPNFAYVDIEGKPTTLVDFAESTDGFESPGAWRSSLLR